MYVICTSLSTTLFRTDVCHGMSWSDYDKFREHAQTFFIHLDLRAPRTMAPNTAPLRAARTNKNKSCETWNYAGECSCDQTQAILQRTPLLPRLRECRPPHCFTVKSANIQLQRSLQEGRARNSQTLTVSLADTVRAYGRGVPNYIGARIPVSVFTF